MRKVSDWERRFTNEKEIVFENMDNQRSLFTAVQRQELLRTKWKIQYIDSRNNGLSVPPMILPNGKLN